MQSTSRSLQLEYNLVKVKRLTEYGLTQSWPVPLLQSATLKPARSTLVISANLSRSGRRLISSHLSDWKVVDL